MNDNEFPFELGTGIVADAIRGHRWETTPLGRPSTWPQSLRTLVGLMLSSTQPMFMAWGPRRVWFYNDAFIPILGRKHPGALGKRAIDEVWAEAKDALEPLFDRVFSGVPVHMGDFALDLDRQGKLEEAHFAFSYTPARDESGVVAGLFGTCIETTGQVLAQRSLLASQARQRRMFEQAPSFICILEGPEHVFTFVNNAHQKLFDSRDWVGKPVREAFPALADQGYFEKLDDVYATGRRYIANAAPVRYPSFWGEAFQGARLLDFIYEPVTDETGKVTGIFCEGFDVTRRKRDEERLNALVRLTDEIRDLDDPDEVAFAAARILGETLQVSRAGYGTVDLARETITIARDWNAPGIESLAGVLEFRDYGSYIENLKRGETVVFADARIDPRTTSFARALEAISARAAVNHPVSEHGGFVALLYLNHADARQWREEDLTLMREIAERTRTATERLRGAQALRELNADLERRVREQTRELSRTWEVSPDILGVCNLDGYFEKSNPAWKKILGWSEAEVASTNVFEFIHPEDVARTQTAWDKLLEGEPAIGFENRYRVKTGGWRWLSWVAVLERHKVYGSARDVTVEKAQAEELAATGLARDRIWRLSTDVMLIADFSARITAVNPAWTGVLGWSEAELLGKSFMDFVHPDDASTTLAEVGKLAEGATTFHFENRYRRKDGGYSTINWTAVPDERFMHAVGRDVTAEREAAALLVRSEEALRQAQKMEAVGQLTGGLAHDFNNLLAGISGSLQVIQMKLAQGRSDDLERFIGVAMSGTRRAAALTQRLLAFSRRQTLDPKPTDANRLVAGMEDLVRRTIGPAIELEVVQAGGLWTTLVDPPQLENALLNLCINARDAMPDGGRLTIETANKWLDERAARERELSPGQYISLCVTDTGTGMTPDVAARAFDPFFTTKPLGEGTGLGLSMVYGFARQSGGQVRIYSELGRGTTMCIYLPRNHGKPEEADAGEAQAAPLVQGSGKVVLVVDDEAAIRMLAGEVLGDAGYAIIEAGDGPTALRILQSDAPVDLLITDVGLPGGMNGRQLADAGRALRSGLPVLFITGYAENAVVGNGYLEPGMQILTKPFPMESLERRIRQMIG